MSDGIYRMSVREFQTSFGTKESKLIVLKGFLQNVVLSGFLIKSYKMIIWFRLSGLQTSKIHPAFW